MSVVLEVVGIEAQGAALGAYLVGLEEGAAVYHEAVYDAHALHSLQHEQVAADACGQLFGHVRGAAQALQVGEVVVAHLGGILEAVDGVVGTRQVELAAGDTPLDGCLEGLDGLFGIARLQAAHAVPQAVVAVRGL